MLLAQSSPALVFVLDILIFIAAPGVRPPELVRGARYYSRWRIKTAVGGICTTEWRDIELEKVNEITSRSGSHFGNLASMLISQKG